MFCLVAWSYLYIGSWLLDANRIHYFLILARLAHACCSCVTMIKEGLRIALISFGELMKLTMRANGPQISR